MTVRPKMLMLSPAWPWPATTGGLVRVAKICESLAEHFRVVFLAPSAQPAPQPPPAGFDDLGVEFRPVGLRTSTAHSVMAALDPSMPYHARLACSPSLRRNVRDELKACAFDYIYCHWIYGLACVPAGAAPRVIVDQHNVDRTYWRNKMRHGSFPVRFFSRWNLWRTVHFENRQMPKIWAYVSVSEQDRVETRSYAATTVANFLLAPNGVDLAHYAPLPADESSAAPETVTLAFLGSMDLAMNILAARHLIQRLLPAVRARLAGWEVRLLIVGRNPPREIREWDRRDPLVTVTGTVPDVAPWLQSAQIFVAPLEMGAGTKLKILEAMACGLPVVGSPLALGGLPEARDGVHFYRANDDATCLERIERLARDAGLRRSLGAAARRYVGAGHGWARIGGDLAMQIVAAGARPIPGGRPHSGGAKRPDPHRSRRCR